jgi:short-subunit dehydrogenase
MSEDKTKIGTALITGASSGIGREIARIHAHRGGDLVIIATRKNRLDELKQELERDCKVNVTVIARDLTQAEAPGDIYKEVQDLGIEVEYLINNAGFGGRGAFIDREWESDLKMIKLNIIALSALTRFFLPDMTARNSGRVLNVSSTASLMPGPLQAVYFATKAYVTFFSNAIAEELRETNVTVTTLMPGATATEFASTSGMDKTSLFNKTASASSVAEAGYYGMLKGKLDVISGITSSQKILFALLPFFSKRMMLRQIHQMQKLV